MTEPRRYWIEFDREDGTDARLWEGVGVTGFDVPDCLSMLADLVGDGPLPPVRRITVDISLAERPPVNRSLGVPVWRGVWYPPVNLGIGPTRAIDRRNAPADYPVPVTGSGRATRATAPTWWDEIPHIESLRWPLVDMHSREYSRGIRERAAALRAACLSDPTTGKMLREALDFMIAWRPTPDDWFDPTGTEFAEQRDLDDYLRAFRDYLFGDRPEPIHPPGSEPLTPEAVNQLIARQLSGER
ncbi:MULTISPECIES: hypothetical protein [unclassified Nocardia]|uniref:hypothetical protein n=1 Tax=unclassified Nocardia TaxID=2637762 RepID=UPI0033BFAB28